MHGLRHYTVRLRWSQRRRYVVLRRLFTVAGVVLLLSLIALLARALIG